MVDYVNVIQVGCSLLIIIAFGFIAFKFKFLPMSAIPSMNLFLFKVCYLCLVARNLAKRKFAELDFMPFVVGALTTITTHILFLLIWLVPFKDKFKNYLSSVLPCSFVNYLVIGIPIFNSIWDSNENVMISMITLSNDLVTTPIYLVLSNIYLARRLPTESGPEDQPVKRITAWEICKTVLIQIVKNPIIIGNVIGFVWSAIGWEIPTFLQSLTTFLGDEVLGICLICVGGFIAQHSIIACHWAKFIVCCIVRHVIMPLITALYCWAFGMSARLSRQCILMTILPTGTTSFLMSSLSGIGPGVSSTMIFWSTVLCVPFLIVWILALDKFQLFVE
ncbi:Auxin Efflux Carrier family protein [Tritrichomonas foetus]|uniref:Auxin Efflux Carrier family protein n=1 Tax=Tritrichomonas foetus TaxID=1144522 RepID=A0A1J4KVM1_9EUKA|nr:Auxin Efflux Carrier family protein [Tritrichomonas foetus]|eukprot:OHT15194.1 Auxin Efflux Carrier family protein [Tritrichomonas foetus]